MMIITGCLLETVVTREEMGPSFCVSVNTWT